MLVNAGGVTVSYFEWLKNLNHVRFGRLTKRWEERSKVGMIQQLEKATGKQVEPDAIARLVAGPSEVRCGLLLLLDAAAWLFSPGALSILACSTTSSTRALRTR